MGRVHGVRRQSRQPDQKSRFLPQSSVKYVKSVSGEGKLQPQNGMC